MSGYDLRGFKYVEKLMLERFRRDLESLPKPTEEQRARSLMFALQVAAGADPYGRLEKDDEPCAYCGRSGEP